MESTFDTGTEITCFVPSSFIPFQKCSSFHSSSAKTMKWNADCHLLINSIEQGNHHVNICNQPRRDNSKTHTHAYVKDVRGLKLSHLINSYVYIRNKIWKCYVWSIALYGAETWTLRKVDQKYLKILKYAGEGWRKVGLIVREMKYDKEWKRKHPTIVYI